MTTEERDVLCKRWFPHLQKVPAIGLHEEVHAFVDRLAPLVEAVRDADPPGEATTKVRRQVVDTLFCAFNMNKDQMEALHLFADGMFEQFDEFQTLVRALLSGLEVKP